MARTAWLVAFFVIGFSAIAVPPVASEASEGPRIISLKNLHTGEKLTVLYKSRGVFLVGGMKKINHLFRDWRRNEPTTMDPRVIDLLWEIYQETGATQPVHIVSGYRSPATNNQLRKAGRGVAKNSQHVLGKAIDFFIPGVKLSRIRAAALRKHYGGVGYYPSSGSPFVHIDVGNVRHWPRIADRTLSQIFPQGGSLHVPASGKPLPGYSKMRKRYGAHGLKPSLKKLDIAGGNYEKQLLEIAERDISLGQSGLVTAYAKVPNAKAGRGSVFELTSLPVKNSRRSKITTLKSKRGLFTAFDNVTNQPDQGSPEELSLLRSLASSRGLATALDHRNRPLGLVAPRTSGLNLSQKLFTGNTPFKTNRKRFAKAESRKAKTIELTAYKRIKLLPSFETKHARGKVIIADTHNLSSEHEEVSGPSEEEIQAHLAAIESRIQTQKDLDLAMKLSKDYLRRLH